MTSISRVRTVFTGVAGTPWYSNMYFTWVSGQTQAHIDLVEAFWTFLVGQIDTNVTATIESDVPVINDATGDITSVESGTAQFVNFTGGGNVLPQATQMLLNLNTGVYVGGRQLRGKVYIPGLIETAADADGLPNSGFQTAQVTAAVNLISGSVTPGAWRVFSPTHGTSAAIQGVSAMSNFAVLRSRRD